MKSQYERIIDEKYSINFSNVLKCFEQYKKNYDIIFNCYFGLENIYNNFFNDEYVSILLRAENNLLRYMLGLKQLANKYLIVVAVRDTPGSKMTKEELDSIHGYGFKSFQSRYGFMYIGIKYNGKVICDKCGSVCSEPVVYDENQLNVDLSLKISSMAWKNGNKAEIIINGIDYAVNIRGVNIVVYDVENNKLIDSVAFDSHTENRVCKHRS